MRIEEYCNPKGKVLYNIFHIENGEFCKLRNGNKAYIFCKIKRKIYYNGDKFNEFRYKGAICGYSEPLEWTIFGHLGYDLPGINYAGLAKLQKDIIGVWND